MERMCVANRYLKRFEELVTEVDQEHKRLSELRSVYDKKLSDYYHKVETKKFNAAEGYYLAKELQEIVRQRRVIKDELYKLNNLRSTLQLNSIVEQTLTARKSLNKIHKRASKSNWKDNWTKDYRVEDLQIH